MEVDLVLPGRDLVVGGLDVHAHLLERQDNLAPHVLAEVDGGEVEVAGRVVRLGGRPAVAALEEEELGFRPAFIAKPRSAASAITRFRVLRGQPANGVPSGLAMSQISRPTSAPLGSVQGNTWNVAGSGFRYMSDSSIRTNPSIEDPSNMIRPSSASPNCRSGTSTFLMTPRMSVNCRRMNFTRSCSARVRITDRRSGPFVPAVAMAAF